jgi:hypothetical protein
MGNKQVKSECGRKIAPFTLEASESFTPNASRPRTTVAFFPLFFLLSNMRTAFSFSFLPPLALPPAAAASPPEAAPPSAAAASDAGASSVRDASKDSTPKLKRISEGGRTGYREKL